MLKFYLTKNYYKVICLAFKLIVCYLKNIYIQPIMIIELWIFLVKGTTLNYFWKDILEINGNPGCFLKVANPDDFQKEMKIASRKNTKNHLIPSSIQPQNPFCLTFS